MIKVKKIQSGRSMLEMISVLAIIGILSLGAIKGYSFAMEKYETNEIIHLTSLIISETRALYKTDNFPHKDDEVFYSDSHRLGSYSNPNSIAAYIVKSAKMPINYNFTFAFNRQTNEHNVGYIGIDNLNSNICNNLANINWKKIDPDVYMQNFACEYFNSFQLFILPFGKCNDKIC